jgi:isopentenyldiphosphate isomerase
MSEKLEVYDLDSNLIWIQDRKEFYEEIRKEFRGKWKITKKVKTIRMLLLNSKWKIILQKRSSIKSENSWMLDKTIWGHVEEWDSFELTFIKEASEELGFPVSLLNKKDFERAIKKTNLKVLWVFKKIDFSLNFISTRISQKWEIFLQPLINVMYIWYYDWPIQFIDWECSGVEVFFIGELKEKIKENPEQFTEDLKFMVKNYEKYLKPIK